MLKKIASKDYPGYYEFVPTRTQRLTKFFQSSPLFRLRPIIVAMMFLASFLYFGALLVKAVLVSIAVYVLMVLPLGSRILERIGLILFVVTATLWLDIIDTEQATSLLSEALH